MIPGGKSVPVGQRKKGDNVGFVAEPVAESIQLQPVSKLAGSGPVQSGTGGEADRPGARAPPDTRPTKLDPLPQIEKTPVPGRGLPAASGSLVPGDQGGLGAVALVGVFGKHAYRESLQSALTARHLAAEEDPIPPGFSSGLMSTHSA